MSGPGFLAGQLLIAMPAIGDERFSRSVIFVCAHDETHAMGLVINCPMEALQIPDLLRQFDIGCTPAVAKGQVLLGGPVEPNRGFVLHTHDDQVTDGISLLIEGDLAISTTRDALESLSGKGPGPRRALLALGYAGWGAGQLEREICENAWLTCPPNEDLLFDLDYHSKWTRALARLGVEPGFLTAESGHA